MTRRIMNLASWWSPSEQSSVTTVKARVRKCLEWLFVSKMVLLSMPRVSANVHRCVEEIQCISF